VDTDKILPHIKTSQDIQLQSIIGTKLLEKCKDLVEADALSTAGNEYYKTLVEDHIAPALVYYCMVDFIPFAAFEIANGGIYQHTPENTTPLEMADISKLVQLYRDKAEFYGARLEDYLCANSSHFPEYSQTDNGDLSSKGQSTFHGWHF
jgi:hypothetical protein